MSATHITRVDVEGFKGARATYDLTRCTAVVGPNRSGKTTLLEAIRFVLGRPVAGQTPDGQNVSALLRGDCMRITLTVDNGTGKPTAIARERKRDAKGSFSRSVVYVDGIEANAGQTAVAFNRLFGPHVEQPDVDWLDISQEALAANIARIGAALPAGRRIVDEAKAAAPGIDVSALGANAVAVFDALAKGTKEWLNGAQKDLRAAQQNADRARAEVGERVEPDALAQAEAAVWAEDAAYLAAAKEAARWGAERDVQMRAKAAWRQESDRLESEQRQAEQVAREALVAVERARGRAAAAGPDVETLRKENIAAHSAMMAAHAKHDLLVGEAHEAASNQTAAEAKLREAEREAALYSGSVPPCRASSAWVDANQIPGPDGIEAHDLAATCRLCLSLQAPPSAAEIGGARAAAAEYKHAAGLAKEAVERASDEYERLYNIHSSAALALDAAEKRNAPVESAAALTATANARAETAVVARRRVAEHKATLPSIETEIVRCDEAAKVANEQVGAKRLALNNAREHQNHVIVSAERQRVADAARADVSGVEKQVESARAALATITKARGALLDMGVGRLLSVAQPEMPAGWTIAVEDSRIGLATDGMFWWGPALSGAERTVLGNAIARAVDGIEGRLFRIVLAEVDMLDDEALGAMRSRWSSAVDAGEINQVVIATWRPARMNDIGDWSVLAMEQPSVEDGAVRIDPDPDEAGEVYIDPNQIPLLPDFDPFAEAPAAAPAEPAPPEDPAQPAAPVAPVVNADQAFAAHDASTPALEAFVRAMTPEQLDAVLRNRYGRKRTPNDPVRALVTLWRMVSTDVDATVDNLCAAAVTTFETVAPS